MSVRSIRDLAPDAVNVLSSLLGRELLNRLATEPHVALEVKYQEPTRTVHRYGCSCGWLPREEYSFAGLGYSVHAHIRHASLRSKSAPETANCDSCASPFFPRQKGDMADLNYLCRRCAEKTAAELSREHNLPLGCSDEERRAALTPQPGAMVWVYSCITPSCSRYRQPWKTTISRAHWRAKHGRSPHCFSCGQDSILEGLYED